MTDFYLETVEWDPVRGVWAVTYGAKVSLVGDELVLPAAATYGAIPAPGQSVFFRLWNDIALVTDFANKELPNDLGIIVAFDAPAAANYVPGDFWTFAVRAG